MIIEHTHETSGNDAAGWAEVGLVKLSLASLRATAPTVRPQSHTTAEHSLLDHLVEYIQAAQPLFSRTLLVDYYRALRSAPLVLISAMQASIGLELARLFAEAIVGADSCQSSLIGGTEWHDATGEHGYYRSLHQRFSTMRCHGIAGEAAEAANIGKAYFVQFAGLSPEELAAQVDVFIPDLSSVALSAVVAPQQIGAALARFPQAALLEVRVPTLLQQTVTVTPPPVGYQRIWLRAVAQSKQQKHCHSECSEESQRRQRICFEMSRYARYDNGEQRFP